MILLETISHDLMMLVITMIMIADADDVVVGGGTGGRTDGWMDGRTDGRAGGRAAPGTAIGDR